MTVDVERLASVRAKTSQLLITTVTRIADERGIAMSIAVVDVAGKLKAFHRMDGAILLSVDAAMSKAHSASTVGQPTLGWYDVFKDDPALLHGAPVMDGIVMIGGGIPLRTKDGTVGGLGVSGGHTHLDDDAIARAAAAEVGFSTDRS